MRFIIINIFILISNNLNAEICFNRNQTLYHFMGNQSQCDQDLANNGAALINSINSDNLASNTPSQLEKNMAIAMLNYLTKGLVQVSQIDEVTMAGGNPLLPTGDLGRECRFDKINTYINCPETFSSERIKALFGENKTIEEIITENITGEILHARNNSNGQNNRNQCLSNKERSFLNQQDFRMTSMNNLIGLMEDFKWNPTTNSSGDELFNEFLQSNDIETLRDLAFPGIKDQLPFISNMLNDKDSIVALMNKFHRFKQSNPSITSDDRNAQWAFYQSLFSDSDLMSSTRSALTNHCRNMFQQFGEFICKPMKFHAVNNDNYYNINVLVQKTDSDELAISTDPNERNSTYYLDYLMYCQGKHCFREDSNNINQNYCAQKDDSSGFNANSFISILEDFDRNTYAQLNNNLYREEYLYGNTELGQSAVCDLMCTGTSPACNPKKSYETIVAELKCGTAQAKSPECQNDAILSWLEIQDMQKRYETQVATYNEENGISSDDPMASYSPFMRNFLGDIGQQVLAGQTPVLTGIKAEDRSRVDRETLADTAAGNPEFDAPDRSRDAPGTRRATLTETLARMDQNPSSTNWGNQQQGAPSGARAPLLNEPNFVPLQRGSMGEQIATAIPSRERERFIQQNADLMRDLLSGQSETTRRTLGDLDRLLRDNEHRFNTGVNVNNSINNPETPRVGSTTGNRNSLPTGGVLGVGDQPIAAPDAVPSDEEETPVIGRASSGESGGAQASSGAAARGPAAVNGPSGAPSGPSINAEIENLESITFEELQRQNISLDGPFILVINSGERSVRVRVVPMQHNGRTILAPDISGIGEDEYFVYPLLKRAAVFQDFFAYREEQLNSIRAI